MQCRFTLGTQQVCTCITLFHTFYRYHYTATTQNFLNCFMFYIFVSVWMTQHKNVVFVSLTLVYIYSHWDFNERKACQHLANCTRWWLLKQCKFTSLAVAVVVTYFQEAIKILMLTSTDPKCIFNDILILKFPDIYKCTHYKLESLCIFMKLACFPVYSKKCFLMANQVHSYITRNSNNLYIISCLNKI